MSVGIPNEQELNEARINSDQMQDGEMPDAEDMHTTDPSRKKYHSSALYAASLWRGTVSHVRPQHRGGSFLPLQA